LGLVGNPLDAAQGLTGPFRNELAMEAVIARQMHCNVPELCRLILMNE
jgi:hypothetical protein